MSDFRITLTPGRDNHITNNLPAYARAVIATTSGTRVEFRVAPHDKFVIKPGNDIASIDLVLEEPIQRGPTGLVK